MYPFWLLYAFSVGFLTTFLYRDWHKGTFKGIFTRIAVTFLIASIPPHAASFIWRPLEGEKEWLDLLMLSSIAVQVLYFIGLGISSLIRSKIHDIRADRATPSLS